MQATWRRDILGDATGDISLHEKSEALANGPLLLVVARCLLKVEQQVLQYLQNPVAQVVVKRVHVKVVWGLASGSVCVG